MILNRSFYSKISPIRGWWYRRQASKLQGERLFKAFRLHKTDWPDKLYFYSSRLKRNPRFIGTKEQLQDWQESKMCETLCPTQAIKVTADAFIIDDRGCIGCGLCVEAAPQGLFEVSSDIIYTHQT